LCGGQQAGEAMRVLFVTSEVQPLAKTGGLADVSGALPIALARRGIDVRLMLPAYPSALAQLKNPKVEATLPPIAGVDGGALISGTLPDTGIPVWLVDAPALFLRNGGLYQDETGRDWPDNAQRFAFLSHVAVHVAQGKIRGWDADIVHANDWHAGLVPLLLGMQGRPRPASVFTIHNLAYQGNFPREVLGQIGIPEYYFATDGVEFYGRVSFLKAAIRYADRVTTVSPTYACETLTPEFGCGLDGLLRRRRGDYSGILNGIDDALWNPATDPHLARNFCPQDLSGKRLCKAALQKEMGLQAAPAAPLVGFVSRFAHQKMADVVLEAIAGLVEAGAQFVALGEGDAALEAAFAEAANRFPGRVAARIGYSEPLAHRLQAGADILLAPARFEPCGLTQLYAARYGTLSVVRRTGGLADTIADAAAGAPEGRLAAGFTFVEPSLCAFQETLGRALALFGKPLAWRRLQLQAMAQDFSWNASAADYIALYRALCGRPRLVAAAPASERDDDQARQAS